MKKKPTKPHAPDCAIAINSRHGCTCKGEEMKYLEIPSKDDINHVLSALRGRCPSGSCLRVKMWLKQIRDMKPEDRLSWLRHTCQEVSPPGTEETGRSPEGL